MVHQQALMILCPIIRDQDKSVKQILLALDQDLRDNNAVLFDHIPTTHFARWAVLDRTEDSDGNPLPAQLLFSANIDGDTHHYINDMLRVDAELISRLYAHCEGFAEPSARDNNTVFDYLQRHTRPYAAFYIGAVGLSAEQIKREESLRIAIENHIDDEQRAGRFTHASASAIRDNICTWVGTQETLRWALHEEPGPSVGARARFYLKALAILFGVMAFAFYFYKLSIALLLCWLALLRWHENKDKQHPYDDNAAQRRRHIRRLSREEDRIIQNPMTSVTHIKHGYFRLITLKIVLFLIEFLARYYFNKGRLGIIPTIHFARWALIDDARRLVFLSNYDGSWENYLGDFVDKAAIGLTAVWSNTIGFPNTRWLIFGGAEDEERFKAYTRKSQVLTQFWYSAYKHLTVDNILCNQRIRQGIRASMSEKQAQQWLLNF